MTPLHQSTGSLTCHVLHGVGITDLSLRLTISEVAQRLSRVVDRPRLSDL